MNISFIGNLCTGKTSLINELHNRLQKLGYESEINNKQFQDNQYLKPFYQHKRVKQFDIVLSSLCLLLQNQFIENIKENIKENKKKKNITLFDRDIIEIKLFNQYFYDQNILVYQQYLYLENEIEKIEKNENNNHKLQFYVFLHSDDEQILYDRLKKRNRDKDKEITLEYIKEINYYYDLLLKQKVMDKQFIKINIQQYQTEQIIDKIIQRIKQIQF